MKYMTQEMLAEDALKRLRGVRWNIGCLLDAGVDCTAASDAIEVAIEAMRQFVPTFAERLHQQEIRQRYAAGALPDRRIKCNAE